MSALKKVIYLTHTTGYWGRHSSYGQVARYVSRINPDVEMISPCASLINRMVGKAYSFYRRWPPRRQEYSAAEWQFLRSWAGHEGRIGHILDFESHHLLLDSYRKAPSNLIGSTPSKPRLPSRRSLARFRPRPFRGTTRSAPGGCRCARRCCGWEAAWRRRGT